MVQGPAARESGEAPHDDRRIAEDLLSYAEDVLPGLREHITFVEPAADQQVAAHPKVHRMGPIYGWMKSPAQTGLRRLAPTTPAWPAARRAVDPARGAILWVAEPGIYAARLALGATTAAPPLPLGLTTTHLPRDSAGCKRCGRIIQRDRSASARVARPSARFT